jgi:hypothetical protein
MYGELGYAAANVHLFYVLSCVERHVDCNFSKDHHKLPEDGPDGPKHVGANA